MPRLKCAHPILEAEAKKRFLNISAFCRMLNACGKSQKGRFYQSDLCRMRDGQRGISKDCIARVMEVLKINLYREEEKLEKRKVS